MLQLSRMRFSANNVGDHILSPTHRLPPVQVKKKANRRCYVCARKTGLASTYQCRYVEFVCMFNSDHGWHVKVRVKYNLDDHLINHGMSV